MVKVCVWPFHSASKWLFNYVPAHWVKTYLQISWGFFFFFPLKNIFRISFFFSPQVLSDYLVKKLETEPFIYPRPRICSCRTSRLPHATLGATPALTCGDHPYRRWEVSQVPLLLRRPLPWAETGLSPDDCTPVRDKARGRHVNSDSGRKGGKPALYHRATQVLDAILGYLRTNIKFYGPNSSPGLSPAGSLPRLASPPRSCKECEPAENLIDFISF